MILTTLLDPKLPVWHPKCRRIGPFSLPINKVSLIDWSYIVLSFGERPLFNRNVINSFSAVRQINEQKANTWIKMIKIFNEQKGKQINPEWTNKKKEEKKFLELTITDWTIPYVIVTGTYFAKIHVIAFPQATQLLGNFSNYSNILHTL